MKSLKEEAKEYQPKQTNNIADLKEVDLDIALFEELETEYPYKYIEVDGQRYRVPNKVLGDIKAITEKKADLKRIAVMKKGNGINTQYTVIPLE